MREKIYDLVAKSVLRLAFPKAEYEDTEIEVTANGEIFKSKKTIQIKDGWRVFDERKSL
ncbi:hypothetical protein FACS1894132_07840 [Clostridia bacterium]|nr:hypothetical protein FACS1894132_07840 [Clostridia bacterium]